MIGNHNWVTALAINQQGC